MELEMQGLRVSVDNKEIIKGVDLTVRQGEIHAIMGPNGSGKSTLAYALMGHPRYKVVGGEIRLGSQSIINFTADKRAKMGLFLAFQYPIAVSGVSLFNFLRASYNAIKQDGEQKKSVPVVLFRKMLKEKLQLLGIDEAFVNRYTNEGFSGGEKKRCEILQLAVLQPKIAVLDETDSGLDIDALKIVANGVNSLGGPDLGVILITHYQRILRYIKPHFVHVLVDGKIAASGGEELAERLEEKGYNWVKGDESEVA